VILLWRTDWEKQCKLVSIAEKTGLSIIVIKNEDLGQFKSIHQSSYRYDNIWGNTVNKYGGNKFCEKTLGEVIVSTKRRYQTTK